MDKTYFHLLVVLHFLTASLALSVANNINDLNALLAFKAAIHEPHNILPINWSTSASVCSWIGITCDTRHQRIAAIDLPNMDLIGAIPPKLGNLSFLVHFNIINNSFHGKLPKELAQLRRLKYINLEGNGFAGEFPSWLAALTRLRYLNFGDNRFSGSLPGGVFNSTNLQTINLFNNFLTGNLPQEFSALPKLQNLNISYNQLSGPLPRALFNLSSLQMVDLTNNSLSGYLPARICDHLPQLQDIELSLNYFEGDIPSGIGECSRLQILHLSYNKFTGDIPKGIWNLTTLTGIYFTAINVTGEIPQNISNLQNLEMLFIELADLTGVLPPEICKLYNLKELVLGGNKLTGVIPSQIFNISTLQVIDLTANDFSGNVPSTLGITLPNLENLYLGRNKLSGAILTSISNASKLSFLDLNVNRFFGAIPHDIGNLRFLEHLSFLENNFSYESPYGELNFFMSLSNCRYLEVLIIGENPLNGFLPKSIGNLSKSLEWFDLSNSGIKDEIPSSIGNLSNLAILSLAENGLKGIIPTTIGELSKLQRINLEGNKIEGSIPRDFCYLVNLGELRLRSNRFLGAMPSCLENITSLRYIYLDSNNLSSNIPASFWSLRDMLTLDLSMNSLTGFLPPEIGNLKVLINMNLSRNQFLGEIPSAIGELQNLQELSLAHNKLQGLIPESMKNILGLQYLDMSFNSLAGVIPNSLEVLLDLKYFNVSYNKLSGQIPEGVPFMNFTNLSFLSNEALCGAPWFQPCRTSKNSSRAKRLLFIILIGMGSAFVALIISLLLMRKLRRKVMAPAHDLLPITTTERVSFDELRQITNGFNENSMLGTGTFGSVYKGVRENGMTWAVKVFNLQLEDAFKSFHRECEALRCLRHRNLTKVISACSSPDFKALVLEYMPNGSLEKWLYLENHFLSIAQRLDIMIDVACGLEYLHYGYSIPVVHCDLKPSNILLDDDMVGHVSDFGITKLLGDEESVVQTKTLATFGYIAPEYGLHGLVSTRCDVYSFGITLMETFTRRRPKDEMFTNELCLRSWIQESLPNSVIQVLDGNLLHHEEELVHKKIMCISSLLQLALSCTEDIPEKRINMKGALVSLQKIKCQFLEDI